MRLCLTLALLPALALSSPVAAASLSGMGANLFGNYFHFGQANLQKPPVKSITAGSLRIDLQHTKLSQVRAAFGGTIMSAGGGKSVANWLCYHSEKGQPTDTWFISNTLGGGEFVMIVAVQASRAGDMPADCVAAPAKFSPPNMGIPGIGASTADLKKAFGGASGSSQITYRADEPGADALGTALNAQYIAYMMGGGKVVGYGAGETSVPAPPKN